MRVLAVDCGGSTVRARVTGADGETLFEGTGGPANWASTPRDSLTEHLRESLAGAPTADFALACMAGILTEADRAAAGELLASLSGIRETRVVPDFYASLASCDHPDALCVLSGTGSLICSFDDHGGVFKSGGGGPLLGDWGSGYWTGRTALGRFLFPRPDAQPSPALISALFKQFQATDINEAMAKIYRSETPAATIAAFGSEVAHLATEGDDYCQSILADAMQPLADLAIEHMRSQGFPQRKFKVFRTGGFWKASHFVSKYFEVLLHLPTYDPPLTPLEGAVRLAQQYAKS